MLLQHRSPGCSSRQAGTPRRSCCPGPAAHRTLPGCSKAWASGRKCCVGSVTVSSSGSSSSRRRACVKACSSTPAAATSYVLSAAVDSSSSQGRVGGAGADNSSSSQQQHQQPQTVLPEHAHLTHLVSLSVSDFALISSSSVQLQPGFTAISGSSGAGKSALIEALSLLLGGPPPGDCVRPPAAAAVVEGSWWLAPGEAAAVGELLRQAGLPGKALPQLPAAAAAAAAAAGHGAAGGDAALQGGWLHLRREVAANRSPTPTSSSSSSSRSRVLINGTPTSLRVVRAVADLLVDVNGQAASLALRDTQQQLLLLDRVAGVTRLRQALSAAVGQLGELERRLGQVEALGDDEDRAALQRRIDIIDRAGLQPGEDVTLRRRLQAMEARRGCLETAAALQAALKGDGSSSGSSGGGRGAAAGVGGSSLLEGVGLVMLQLRGLLSTEEQQRRLLLAERQQLRAAAAGGSSSGSNGGSNGVQAGSVGAAGQGFGHGQAQGDLGDEEGEEEFEEGEEEEGEGEGEEDDSDPEAAASAAGLSALRVALEELEAVEEGLREAQAQLLSYAGAVDYSPSEAASISTRLELISKLARRFRASRGASGLLELQQQWSDQLEHYYASQGQAEAWRAEAAQLQESIAAMALQLSAARAAAAGRLAAAVQAQLGELVMGSSRFAVRLDWSPAQESQVACSHAALVPAAARPPMEPLTAAHTPTQQQQQPAPDSSAPSPAAGDDSSSSSSSSSSSGSGPKQLFRVSPSGLDAVTFLLAAGPSEPLRPLADVASGGEAARVMLALKAAAAAVAANSPGSSTGSSSSSAPAAAGVGEGGPPPVLVLDELDAGVGSRLGAPIGRLLQRLVAGAQPTASQVLVVTHTPQVAACASQHIQALKGPGPDGRMSSTFRALSSSSTERLDELADMMGLLPPQQQQQQQQQMSEEGMRARQLAAQLLAAAQEGASLAAGAQQPNAGSSSNGGKGGSSSGDASVFAGLSAAAAAAGAAQQQTPPSEQQQPEQGGADTCGN